MVEGSRAFHVVDRWRYLGHAPSLAEAATLLAASVPGAFELSTWRVLQSHLARGLSVLPLSRQPTEPAASAIPAAAPVDAA
jgi:DNA polymerase-3 subunit epsilon